MSTDHVANNRKNRGLERLVRAKWLGEAIETRVLYARPASTEGHAERIGFKLQRYNPDNRFSVTALMKISKCHIHSVRVSMLQYLRSGYRHVRDNLLVSKDLAVSPENLGHMATLSSKQETNKALHRGLMHGTNFPEHVRSTSQRDDSGQQGVSGPSCPTLDPRFSEAEGRGTEETFGLSFGFQIRIIPTSDR
ncbi:hypothetical protein WN51_09466 [Melipona quadrifasciata]|uniref:Uncharacterized protein n=1 Tax=Melipona quadrifasciata TaxID=166423 RepID=A0A0M9A6A2_9HYME|nr:hypothetical protein WN51_09466 [Melipona quadrifasciata]